MPAWLRRRLPPSGRSSSVEHHLARQRLHTVCEEAKCPNRNECFGAGTATFLILGDVCTRRCGFCGVAQQTGCRLVDTGEPERIAATVKVLGLDYAVVTSVTRDDLPDGGAEQFCRVVVSIRQEAPRARIEILVPDFGGDHDSLLRVLDSGPEVFNHNVETVRRLYPSVRPQAGYDRSMAILGTAAAHRPTPLVKSGLMVGLGESPDEVLGALSDLKQNGCSIVTIGQYLQPSDRQIPVQSFVVPRQFREYAAAGRKMGILEVIAGPYVRSSYRAGDVAGKLLAERVVSYRGQPNKTTQLEREGGNRGWTCR